MFLYELAIELGVHSSELVDAAGTLGLGALTPATMLSAAEVAALRQHLAIAGPPRRAVPGAEVPPLPAVPTGPLVAEPPGGERADAAPMPRAPADWGPPVPPRAVPAPPPPPPARPATGVPAPAVFAPPSGAVPTFEPPSGLPGAASAPPATGLGGPSAASPPTAWAVPTDPPPPGAGPPGAMPPPAPGGGDGWSMGQKVSVGVVALLVVGLFGFMLANTGPDEARERELALADQRIEREREEAARTTTTAPTTTAPETTTTTARGRNEVADLDAFCAGGLGIAPLEARLMAAVIDGNLGEMAEVVRDRRAGWTAAVDQLRASGPPSLQDEVDTYRSVYDRFLDAIASSSSIEALYTTFSEAELERGSEAGRAIAAQVTFHCR